MARPGAAERRALGAGSAWALAATRRLDLGHDPRAWVEELLLDLRPAADVLDREQLRAVREVQPLRHTLDDGAVAVLREDPLRRLRAQEVQERLRLRLVLRGRRDGDRVLDQDRRLRDHELNGLALLLCEQGLVLVREEDIASAGEERLQPFTRARRLGDDVLPHLREVGLGLLR